MTTRVGFLGEVLFWVEDHPNVRELFIRLFVEIETVEKRTTSAFRF